MATPEEGRKLLAEWKAAHVEKWSADGGFCVNWTCLLDWPCPTARLVAAVEEALDLLGPRSYADEDTQARILSALAVGR